MKKHSFTIFLDCEGTTKDLANSIYDQFDNCLFGQKNGKVFVDFYEQEGDFASTLILEIVEKIEQMGVRVAGYNMKVKL